MVLTQLHLLLVSNANDDSVFSVHGIHFRNRGQFLRTVGYSYAAVSDILWTSVRFYEDDAFVLSLYLPCIITLFVHKTVA